MRRHMIENRRVEVGAGIAALVTGALLLHDAFEGRARRTPLWLRPFTWW